MRIAIMSDIHDNLPNLEKFLDWCKRENIAEIICCGDVTNAKTLRFLSHKFKGKIHLVRGNISLYGDGDVEKYKNIKYYGKIGIAEIGGKKIGLCHEPYLIASVLTQGQCDIVFYGHTHAPWASSSKNGHTKNANPGTLGGMFNRATFAVWDTDTERLELKLLDQV